MIIFVNFLMFSTETLTYCPFKRLKQTGHNLVEATERHGVNVCSYMANYEVINKKLFLEDLSKIIFKDDFLFFPDACFSYSSTAGKYKGKYIVYLWSRTDASFM